MRLLAPFRLVVRVTRRFRGERLGQTAAALSFATLLGLVPMIAVAAALIEQVPYFSQGIGVALNKFLLANLLPEKSGTVIAKYVGQFANRAERVTMIGILVLAATALMQMLTIERAFNAIWNVKAPRPIMRRLAIHGLALLLGPLVFGGSLAATTYLAGVSLGLLTESNWFVDLVLRVLPFGFLAGLFALLYWGVPRKNVVPRHAIIGGLLAASAFVGMQRLFGLYIAKFPTYTIVYGPFAAVPIFLAWLYLSWTMILLGALITAELPGSTSSGRSGWARA
jgi:membrane protein